MPITVVSHKPKSKWHSPTFTIRGISREKLSLLLSFAIDGVDKHTESNGDYGDTKELAQKIENYINDEETVRLEPLVIED